MTLTSTETFIDAQPVTSGKPVNSGPAQLVTTVDSKPKLSSGEILQVPVAMVNFVDSQLSPETKRAYKTDLRKWFMFTAGRELDERTALDFRAMLERTVSSRSAARTFNTVRAYLNFADGPNPLTRIKSPRRVKNATPDVPSDQAVDSALERCDNARDRAILALLLNGLRASEVVDLRPVDWKWSDVDECYLIRVLGKGAKQRVVPATKEAERYVLAYLSTLSGSAHNLIRGPNRHKLTSRTVWNVVHKWAPELHPHSMRHHYGTRLIRADVDLPSVQAALGHESIETTSVYINLDLRHIVSELKKDPRNK